MAAMTFSPIAGPQPCSRAGGGGCDHFQERQVSSSARCDLRSSIFPFFSFDTKKSRPRPSLSLGFSSRQRTGMTRNFIAVAAKDTSAATVVAQEVDFVWNGDAKEVFLTGSFLNWEKKIALKKLSEGVFSTKQKLEPGSHTYKFIVDGVWVHSPDAPTIDDGTGGLNNEMLVKEEVVLPVKPSAEPPKPSKPATSPPSPAAAESVTPPAAATAETAATPAAPKPAEAPKPAAKAAPAAKGKKAAAKPIKETMIEDVIPAITEALSKEPSITDVVIVFEDNQLRGTFTKNGIPYCFWAYFPDGTLEGNRGFSLTSHGNPPSTVEPFLIDEKKITADLIVFWVTKRLFAQKLLSLN